MKYVEYQRNGKIIYGWKDITRYGIRYWTLGPFSREMK